MEESPSKVYIGKKRGVLWSGATWEEKVSSWPLIDFNQWVVVWVWDKVVG